MDLRSYQQSSEALDAAGALTRTLGTSQPLPLRPQDEALLADASCFRFGVANNRPAWSLGEGPTVLLVHGYSGRGVQMAMLAHAIARQGFRAVFFDAGGHGDARAEKIGFFTFINDVRDIAEHLDEPLYAMVGHSAGGLAMMRARALHGIRAQRYAVIAAPFFPYVPLARMRANGASDTSLEYVKVFLSDQFQTDWSSLVRGAAFEPEDDKPILAVYDRADDRVSHDDAERIQNLWRQTTVVKTDGHGHNRVLRASETILALQRFLGD